MYLKREKQVESLHIIQDWPLEYVLFLTEESLVLWVKLCDGTRVPVGYTQRGLKSTVMHSRFDEFMWCCHDALLYVQIVKVLRQQIQIANFYVNAYILWCNSGDEYWRMFISMWHKEAIFWLKFMNGAEADCFIYSWGMDTAKS